MLGRPNLSRDYCDRLSVMFYVKLPLSIGEAVQNGSISYTDAEEQEVAFYGKTYLAGESQVVVEARVFRHEQQGNHVNILFINESRGKPPKNIKSPDKLMNLILDNALGQRVDINAFFTYRYNLSDGWNSDPIGLPMPLDQPWRLARGMVLTHIEGVTFRHEMEDKVPERVDISLTPEGNIVHEIQLQREKEISQGMIRSLIREGRRLSSSLVEKVESPDDIPDATNN